MDWFLCDKDLLHERVKNTEAENLPKKEQVKNLNKNRG